MSRFHKKLGVEVLDAFNKIGLTDVFQRDVRCGYADQLTVSRR